MNIFTGDDLYFIVVGDNFQIPLFLRERGRERIVMEIDKGTKLLLFQIFLTFISM